MSQYGADDLLGPALLAEDAHADERVPLHREVRVALVVKVVDQADGAPKVLVLPILGGVGTHCRLDSQHVTNQILVLGVLVQQYPGILACWHELVPPFSFRTVPRAKVITALLSGKRRSIVPESRPIGNSRCVRLGWEVSGGDHLPYHSLAREAGYCTKEKKPGFLPTLQQPYRNTNGLLTSC